MGRIKILEESVSNIIAAGEVVENPASMIKELLENSLDANSKNIYIEVSDSGTYVKITDDGHGMDKEDILLSIERHATSKISKKEDVFNLKTYGFRGEALASIAAVSKMSIETRYIEDTIGYKLNSYAGVVRKFEEISRPVGTEIEIRDLFYNTPARKKFLRKETTEYNKIKEIVLKEALANYNVSITLKIDEKITLKTSGNGLENTVYEIFGKNILKNIKKYPMGYLGNVEILRGTKDHIHTYVNGRYVKSPLMERAVIDGYYTKLMKGKYPFAILFFEVDTNEVDVNVHPSKKFIKFSSEREIYKKIKTEIEDFFYIEERENWQPKLQIKTNVEFKDDISAKEEVKLFESTYDEVDLNKPKTFITDENVDYRNISSTNIEDKISEDIKDSSLYKNPFSDENNNENDFNYFSGIFDKQEGEYKRYNVLGQILDTYILVLRDNNLEIYDQHIIHERLLYEELKEKYNKEKFNSINLLIPEVLELSPIDKNLVFEKIDIFKEFGFDIDEISETEILIRGIPNFDLRKNISEIIMKMIDDLKKNDKSEDIREAVIISMSCRGAIKAGQRLSYDEMQKMVRRLHEVGKYTCPHGRPIIVKISKDELDKMFGRKK